MPKHWLATTRRSVKIICNLLTICREVFKLKHSNWSHSSSDFHKILTFKCLNVYLIFRLCDTFVVKLKDQSFKASKRLRELKFYENQNWWKKARLVKNFIITIFPELFCYLSLTCKKLGRHARLSIGILRLR